MGRFSSDGKECAEVGWFVKDRFAMVTAIQHVLNEPVRRYTTLSRHVAGDSISVPVLDGVDRPGK